MDATDRVGEVNGCEPSLSPAVNQINFTRRRRSSSDRRRDLAISESAALCVLVQQQISSRFVSICLNLMSFSPYGRLVCFVVAFITFAHSASARRRVAVKADLGILPPLFNVSLLEAIRFCWAPVSNATDADITLLGATAGATRCSL